MKYAEQAYKDAKNLKEFGYGRGGLPKGYLLLLAILGWNEVIWLFSSPFIMYPLLFVGSLVGLMFSMGLGDLPKLAFKEITSKISFLS